MIGASPYESFAAEARRSCELLAMGYAQLVGETRGRELLPELSNVATTLARGLADCGQPPAAALAKTLARCSSLLFEGQVDPGQALLLLASGTETLQRALELLGTRDLLSGDALGLDAARYELETIFPVAGQAAKPNKSGPDVTLHSLRKR